MWSCWKRGFKRLLLWPDSAKAYLCKQATGLPLLLGMLSELLYLLSSKTEYKVDCTAGSSVPSRKCCLEPWWKLIGIIWFVWHSYCVEESKNKLRHLYTWRVWSTRTSKLMPKETGDQVWGIQRCCWTKGHFLQSALKSTVSMGADWSYLCLSLSLALFFSPFSRERLCAFLF